MWRYLFWIALVGWVVVAIGILPDLPEDTIVKGGVVEQGVANPRGLQRALNKLIYPARASREIYFNKPSILYVYESDEIKLNVETKALNSEEIDVAFKDLKGVVTHKTARVGGFLNAKLSGPPSEIEINPADQRLQTVTPGSTIIFSWFVRPIEIGKIPVRIDLFSQDSAAKEAPANPVQVMQDEWVVDSRGTNWAKYQIANLTPIGTAFVGGFTLFTGVLAWLGFKGFTRRGEQEQDL
jgi:hypothetical protein